MRCWDTSKAYQTESELTQAGFSMAIQVDLILLCFILLHFADCFLQMEIYVRFGSCRW